MVRNGLGILAAAGALGVIVVAACGDTIKDFGLPKGSGDSGAGGGSSLTSCWPTDPTCYVTDKSGPGGECLAKRDNSPTDDAGVQHIQLRQTWLRPVKPIGNTINAVYGTLNSYTQLPLPACNMSGSTGYIQLFDFTLNAADNSGEARIGFAQFVPAPKIDSALTNGLCMVEGDWANDSYALPADQMTPATGYPVGLPPPMARLDKPWHIKPNHAKRLSENFDLKAAGANGFKTKREEFLASFEAGGANEGYDAVFYYDPKTGKSHGYARMSYIVIYDAVEVGATTPTSMLVVPIREPETNSTFNDPAHPNCIGAYRGDALSPDDSCFPDGQPDSPKYTAWGCANESCKPGEGPATTDGYFLVTELEQVYSKVLHQTLCVSYPGAQTSWDKGWGTSKDGRCRISSKWNPSDPINGIPTGDWCSATNSAGDANCHDAYKSFNYHVFQGFPVQSGVCEPFTFQ